MPSWWVLALAFGASLRLTRFVIADDLGGYIRGTWRRYAARGGQHTMGWTFIECAWCVGMWMSAAVVTAALLLGDSLWFCAPALVLSCSWLIGAAESALDRLDR